MGIAEDSERISELFKNTCIDLKRQLIGIEEAIDVASKEFKEAAAQGDISENSASDEAKKRLKELSTQKAYILYSIDSIERNGTNKIYNPKSEIDIYSTFRLKRVDTGELSTWKIFPGSVSDVESRIMSPAFPVFNSLKGKSAGEFIEVTDQSNGQVIRFDILEVY